VRPDEGFRIVLAIVLEMCLPLLRVGLGHALYLADLLHGACVASAIDLGRCWVASAYIKDVLKILPLGLEPYAFGLFQSYVELEGAIQQVVHTSRSEAVLERTSFYQNVDVAIDIGDSL